MNVPPCKIIRQTADPSPIRRGGQYHRPGRGKTKKGRPDEWTSLRVKLSARRWITLPSAAADSTIGPAGGETKKGRPNEWTSLRVKLGTDLLSHLLRQYHR